MYLSVTLNFSITRVVQYINLLLPRCRVILIWLEDSTFISYWEVFNRNYCMQLTSKCSDTIRRRALLLLHLKLSLFSITIYSFSGRKSDFLGGFCFLASFLNKHVSAFPVSPFYWNIDDNLHVWNKLSFHWQLTEKRSKFVRY